MNNIRIIPRLDIKGRDLIKSIQFEGLRKLETQLILQKNIMMKVLMNFYIWIL